MGDRGRRRIGAPAARHFLRRYGFRPLRGSKEGGGAVKAQPFLWTIRAQPRQRGQKLLDAARYSITVTLRRIRI